MKQIAFIAFFSFCTLKMLFPQVPVFNSRKIEKAVLINEFTRFISSELKFSLDEIQFPGIMPDTLMDEPTGGDFSFAVFAQTLQRYAFLTGETTIGKHKLDEWIRSSILKEIEAGGKTFAQLYVARVLDNSCNATHDLTTSSLWNSFSESEKEEINRF